jgi:colanic acid/amylovoran biosynthesis protein
MTLHLYLTGQRTFANHGCEALVRSIVELMGETFGSVDICVPSDNPERDRRFWPDAAAHGVRFVPMMDLPSRYLWWDRVARRFPLFQRLPWPRLPINRAVRADLEKADLVLSIGGDNYSLDYGLASLFHTSGLDGWAMSRGIPTVLWGASVGPFEAAPAVVGRMRRHLACFGALVVREETTAAYLRTLGLGDLLVPSMDTAVLMAAEPFDLSSFWPVDGPAGTVAINLSPIVGKLFAARNSGGDLAAETAVFIDDLIDQGFSVLLVPHVVDVTDGGNNCDHDYLSRIFDRCRQRDGRISIAPKHLNAPQLKFLLGRCRFMIGARTHAAIGALSSGVPTISLAYSVKAYGINQDLFGHTRYVLDGGALGKASLNMMVERLIADEFQIRATLAVQRQQWRARIDQSLVRLSSILTDRVVRGGDVPTGCQGVE